MLSNEVVQLINEQVNLEFYSAYLYLHYSNYYKEQGLDGFGNWFAIQAQEERDHAMEFLSYLHNNGESVALTDIKAPTEELEGFLAPLEGALRHERLITERVHKIYGAAYLCRDFRTMQFLDTFVKEQGEEEKSAEDLVKRFQLFGSDPKSLYMLDSELGARVYTPAQ